MTAGSRVELALRWTLLGFAFGLPITIAMGEPLAYLAVPLLGWLMIREGRRLPAVPPFVWPLLLFILAACATVFWSVRPAATLGKLDRFLLLGVVGAIPLAWPAGEGDATGWRLARWFMAGASLQAAWDVVGIPWAYVQAGRDFAARAAAGLVSGQAKPPTIFEMGNMRDPQMYLVALSLLLGWFLYRRRGASLRWWWPALVVNAAAFILHFKRGAWLAFLASVVLMALAARRRRVLLSVLVAVAGTLAIPQVQERLAMLKEELLVQNGGRYSLWTRVAPPMMAEHPWGMGWKAPRHEDFKRVERGIQPKLNHLHNNALQVRLETGWLGLAGWLAWMLSALATLWRTYRQAAVHAPDRAGLAFGVLCGFLALQLNGLVEYNFGDTEIFMLMSFLLGLAGLGWLAPQPSRAAPAANAAPAPRW